MADATDTAPSEPRVKVGFSVTPAQWRAMEFVKHIHGDKYDGVASVLRDYSIEQAVQAFELAQSVNRTLERLGVRTEDDMPRKSVK
jgi:hypothetical protein